MTEILTYFFQVFYENISVPVIIAVVVAIALVILLLVAAKVCYSRHHTRRKRVWKAPPTPPTPRLTQYEAPGVDGGSVYTMTGQSRLPYIDDDCRMTLTSLTRDGSTTSSVDRGGGGSVLGVGSTSPMVYSPAPPSSVGYAAYAPPCRACTHMPQMPASSSMCAAPNVCALCDSYPMQTLPPGGTYHTLTLKRYQGNGHDGSIYGPVGLPTNGGGAADYGHVQFKEPIVPTLQRSQSVSPPRMSAEF